MRILFLEQFAELGGAQRGLLDLLPGIAAAGWEPHVAVPGEGPLLRLLREQGAPVHSLSLAAYSSGDKTLSDGLRFVANLPAVAAEIRSLTGLLKPALLYVNGPRLLPAAAAARLPRPILFHAHNAVTTAAGGTMARAALRRLDAPVIAASRFLADHWGPHTRRAAQVIYSGLEGPARPAAARSPDAGPRVGLIGRIHPQKAQKQFVLAARDLARDWPSAEFILCGDVLFSDRRAERYKQELLSLAGAGVTFLGWRDDVYEVLAGLDLLVVPSANEGGIPRVVLEAFSARVPVLALASGGIPEGVEDGHSGFLLHSATAPEIAARIRELLRQPYRLQAAAEIAHRLWREKFTVARYRAEVCAAVSAGIQNYSALPRVRRSKPQTAAGKTRA
jgi:glycosyltransferase involved in cell wall biosynthesis